jgi:hypothetical protein
MKVSRRHTLQAAAACLIPTINGSPAADDEIVYPRAARAVIDVTKPPYNLDRTGKRDCTQALIRLIDQILRPELEGMKRVAAKLEANPDPEAKVGFESRKMPDGSLRIIFPEDLPEQRILYFPNGVYLVSDTICYSFAAFHNTVGNELNRGIRLIGQSRKGVVLRLRDRADGFGPGASKPVLSFIRGERSNIAMSNFLENMTIDTGSGNPGAIGVEFHANNTGAVRRVTIRSGDPEGRGTAGLSLSHELVSGVLVQDVDVQGFDYGIQVTPIRMYTVFERIHVSGQRVAGFTVGENIASIRRLHSVNRAPALTVTGAKSHVTVIDADLQGGAVDAAAIDIQAGAVFARDIQTRGYKAAIRASGETAVAGPNVAEYCSQRVYSLFDGQKESSLKLRIRETPGPHWENRLAEWFSVEEAGAKGDGATDDTESIQRAMRSGKPIIYFQPGKYVLNGPIEVPASVRRINFMFCDLIAGPRLRLMKESGTFRVTGRSADPLVFEDLWAWEKFFGYMRLIEHASTRTVVLRDLHVQTGALYFNSVTGGEVFIENICSTPGGGEFRVVPCLSFRGQTVWARQLNPERSLQEVISDASTVWVLGFKTEAEGTAFTTLNGGATEVLGGVFNIGHEAEVPLVLNDNSDVSVVAATNGYTPKHSFPLAVREIQNGQTKVLRSSDLPERFAPQYTIPLYVGRRR